MSCSALECRFREAPAMSYKACCHLLNSIGFRVLIWEVHKQPSEPEFLQQQNDIVSRRDESFTS